MKTKFIVGTVLSAIAGIAMATTASAADLPRKTAPQTFVQAVPLFTWTGFYVGINGGYMFDTGNSGNGNFGFGNSSSGDGFTIGGTVGYNQQFGNIVVGIEGDLSYVEQSNRNNNFFFGNNVGSNDMSYLGTVRGRIGFAFDRLLVYGTGGLAFADQNNNANFGFGGGSNDDVKFGYTIGAGLEYAFTNNWSVKAEYLYYDLGSSRNNTFFAGPGFFANNSDNRGNLVRAGLNYRF